jgi:hypothetical protein
MLAGTRKTQNDCHYNGGIVHGFLGTVLEVDGVVHKEKERRKREMKSRASGFSVRGNN